MTTTTTTTKRRTTRGVHAQPMGRTQVGGTRPRQTGAVNESETRAVMVGHTVRVLVDYDGLKGCFGTVLEGDFGDGKVLVEVASMSHESRRREVCFLSREVEVVPGNDTLRHTGKLMNRDNDVHLLIRRCTDLRMIARGGEVSEALQQRLHRRAQRLHDEIRCLQRSRAAGEAHKWVRLVGNPCCTALVIWTGKEAA